MRLLLALSLALIIGESCQATDSRIHFNGPIGRRSSEILADTISKSFTKFTLDLDKAIDKLSNNRTENVVLSPASLTATLVILLLGSAGETFNEISKALHLDSDTNIYKNSENVHIAIGNFMKSYESKLPLNKTLPISKTSTGLFVQNGFPFRHQFLRASKNIYGSDVFNVDFAEHNKNAQDVINKWTSKKTARKIQKILTEPPPTNVKLFVSSAIYFNGKWDKEFISTYNRFPFHVELKETVLVPMMLQTDIFPYLELKNQLTIIGLPYKGSETMMYVIRPDAPGTNGLRKIKDQLTSEILDSLIDKMKNQEVDVGLPKIKLSSNVNLKDALSALNLKSLFDPDKADMSILSPGLGSVVEPSNLCATFNNFGIDKLRNQKNLNNPELFVDQMTHAVDIRIDEKGTEAAASTNAFVSSERMSRPQFYANKPFLFFIRHNPTKSILFWGSINRPTSESF